MQEPKVSVIMPVYNVEKYLRRAVDCVLNQSFSDFEIILVDDGSTDGSGGLCDSLAQSDSRIFVIHKQNGGVSSARNAAIDIAKGKYIYFMDPDDCFTGELLKDNIEIAEQNNCCQVVFGFENRICSMKSDVPVKTVYYLHGIDGTYTYEQFKSMYEMHLRCVNQVVWNRLYSRESIGETRFSDSLNTAEDAVFNMELLKKGFEKICYNNRCYYVYYCRQNSLMNKYNPKRFENELVITDMIEELAENFGIEDRLKAYVSLKYTETVLAEYGNMSMHDCPLKTGEICKIMAQYCRIPKIDEAIKGVLPHNLCGISLKVLHGFTKYRMYFFALYFKRIITPLSIFAHKTLGCIKK